MTLEALARHLLFCAALALLSAAIVRRMISAGVVDRPDPRKAHTRPIPKGGGVGVVAAFLVGIGALYLFADFARIANAYFLGVIAAASAIALVAFLDDLRDWSFRVKLAAQLAAALAAVGTGLVVTNLHLPLLRNLPLGPAAPLAALLWIVYVTNAMNFIDGLNGLAAGVSLITALALSAIAASFGDSFVYFAGLLLASGLIGFLPFNFPRARIFMGDVGSQFCGFVLAVLGIVAARFDRTELSALLVPMMLFGVLYDVAFTLVRRALAGENITQPHRGHLYQLAHRAGVDPIIVAMIHWGFALWGVAVSLLFLKAAPDDKPLIPLLVFIPQVFWTYGVIRAARSARLDRW